MLASYPGHSHYIVRYPPGAPQGVRAQPCAPHANLTFGKRDPPGKSHGAQSRPHSQRTCLCTTFAIRYPNCRARQRIPMHWTPRRPTQLAGPVRRSTPACGFVRPPWSERRSRSGPSLLSSWPAPRDGPSSCLGLRALVHPATTLSSIALRRRRPAAVLHAGRGAAAWPPPGLPVRRRSSTLHYKNTTLDRGGAPPSCHGLSTPREPDVRVFFLGRAAAASAGRRGDTRPTRHRWRSPSRYG